MNTAAAYRTKAEACAKLVQAIHDPYAKMVLLNMAEAWLRLADYVEHRNRPGQVAESRADGSPDNDMDLK